MFDVFLFISVAAILKDYIVTRMMTSSVKFYSFFTRCVSTVVACLLHQPKLRSMTHLLSYERFHYS